MEWIINNLLLFTRHKDIDRASALLEGVQGWHITGRKRTGKRKDKIRCRHYVKGVNGCKLNHNRIGNCVGVSSCVSYHE